MAEGEGGRGEVLEAPECRGALGFCLREAFVWTMLAAGAPQLWVVDLGVVLVGPIVGSRPEQGMDGQLDKGWNKGLLIYSCRSTLNGKI